jgi:hypothetical protein
MSSVHEAYERLVPLIGHAGEPTRGTVYARDIERFAVASGDQVPVPADQSGRIAAPPMMLTSIIECSSGPPLAALRADGTGVGREGWLPLEGLRLMGGGQDLVFHADVLSDQSFTATPMLEEVQLKDGRSGPLLLLTITTVFRDQDDRELVTCRETIIGR